MQNYIIGFPQNAATISRSAPYLPILSEKAIFSDQSPDRVWV